MFRHLYNRLAKASSISGVADLGSNHKVCYNTASSFNTNLVAAKSSEQGLSPCHAMVPPQCWKRTTTIGATRSLDDVILQGDLVSRRQQAHR